MGLAVRDVQSGRRRGIARGDRLRRVLRLLQFLPRRVRAAARRALLQAGHRAARRAKSACCARLASGRRRCAGCSWPKAACSPWLAARSAPLGAVGYAVAADGWPAIVVGGRGRNDGAHAACLHHLAGRRRDRRHRRGAGVHLVDAAKPRQDFRAQPPRRAAAMPMPSVITT